MAHGWFLHLGGSEIVVDSAGTKPNPKGIHPLAIAVMAEEGIDIAHHSCDSVTQYINNEYDVVLTVCDVAKEQCPVFPNAKHVLHHSIEDPDYPGMPADEFHQLFRRIRDEIGKYCRGLLLEYPKRTST